MFNYQLWQYVLLFTWQSVQNGGKHPAKVAVSNAEDPSKRVNVLEARFFATARSEQASKGDAGLVCGARRDP